jgi:hypothetical protein
VRASALIDSTLIASGFPERFDPNALVIDPTGVARFSWLLPVSNANSYQPI